MKQRFTVIGISDSRQPQFDAEASAAIARGRVFSGGRRHREAVEHLLPENALWIEITLPIDDVLTAYREYDEVVVFASGDPLFFGFGATLRRRLPDAEIRVFPVANSLQMLAHKAVIPYGDMRTVSLTGRPWRNLDRALTGGEPLIGILTDRTHTPAAIAARMLEYGYDGYEMTVGENLGNESTEKVRRMSLSEAAESEFAMPNCVILQGTPRRAAFGLAESGFELLDGRTKMITKMPIRLATLAAAELERAETFWDIGFCTGSVSIEARLRFPHLNICSFEIRPEGERLMRENARRFGAPGIETFIGDFMDAPHDSLPAPDAVFIGGHGGNLSAIVAKASQYLATGGRMVFNSVSAASAEMFAEAADAAGMQVVQRQRIAVDDYNPVTIIKAVKKI